MCRHFCFKFFSITVALLATTITFGASLALAADAPQPSEPRDTTATYGDWVLHCIQRPNANNKNSQKNRANCEIVQSATVKGQSRPVMQLAVGQLPNQKGFTITTVLPTDVSIPGQVNVVVNTEKKAADNKDDSLALALTRCLPNGCVAVAKLTSALRTKMGAAKVGQLQFIRANGQKVGFPLSWMGFTQAMAALETKD
ncbi:invasion associated locus B family protein [Vibrio gazogenes]|uniref:Invasion protein IalB, involved in pathogenesis n=1 Tax=Vibrio gazogenes DSM 21264 = NBRC 103151 TaxID=1123492 RepID=A0A1M5H2F9_VIBGA|nr:invasion associated locus B family protein [Vibrio gazogenes]USP14927.1 invasion associated locus B family protein [Vibrio gazogenes]SHG10046.1 Invasion protein IalB, involved in pathogenesis [Vibrio gazogenes DSM 21264] [Vibrio gazogenes DSM 21264 = NBRC 103151]SJN53542.1 Invasion associated locus B (IalB) protein [Vibrio gazogenes]